MKTSDTWKSLELVARLITMSSMFGVIYAWGEEWVVGSGACTQDVHSVQALHWDGRSMWVGTDGATLKLQNDECEVFSDPSDVIDIAGEAGGTIWAESEHEINHLWRYEGDSWKRRTDVYISTIEDGDFNIVDGMNRGPVCYSPVIVDEPTDNGVPFTVESGRIFVEPTGVLWLYYPEGAMFSVLRFASRELECWKEDLIAPGTRVMDVSLVNDEIWVLMGLGSAPHIVSYAEGSWVFVDYAPDLAKRIIQDVDGIVWSVGPRGAFIFEDNGWRLVLDRSIEDACGAKTSGGIWAIDEEGLVIRLMADGKETITLEFPHEKQTRSSLAVDGLGRLWIGDTEGVFYLDSTTPVGAATWGTVKRLGTK